jgi:hypothetical protein
MLSFAYGSNMSRALMHGRCRDAVALGTARLDGWRFLICPEGYASIEPQPGAVVHGVLWRLSLRDLAAVDAYENLASGLYARRVLAIRFGGRLRPASVYIAGRQGEGTAMPSYVKLVLDAARDWHLPDAYVRSLQRWSSLHRRGTRRRTSGRRR